MVVTRPEFRGDEFGNNGQLTVYVDDLSFENDGKFTANLTVGKYREGSGSDSFAHNLGQDLVDKLNSLADG